MSLAFCEANIRKGQNYLPTASKYEEGFARVLLSSLSIFYFFALKLCGICMYLG
jgi:hypothetical protein